MLTRIISFQKYSILSKYLKPDPMTPLKTGIAFFIFALCIDLSGQNLIGYREKEIKKYMKENHKDFNFQNMVYNSTFKYLKYQDISEMQTVLFFLTADSVCKGVRLVCDKSLEAEKIKELNSKYTRTGNNSWTETRNGKKYVIELKEEEWSFNVTYVLNE
jgi:hypothetical protein